MVRSPSRPYGFLLRCSLLILLVVTACGTFEVAREEPTAAFESLFTPTAATATPESELATTPIPTIETAGDAATDVVAWYGSIHSVAGAESGYDYFKLWHLDIWPKFGRAVGVAGADPAITAEIERLRDTDTKATFWGRLTCGVGDYGACQLLVTRLSADDGGPGYDPQLVEGWEGAVGHLTAQPGSPNSILYFVLSGEVPALYGVSSADPAIQEELERLSQTGSNVRIWGELRSKARPVTGTLIEVERLERMDPS